jgi:hypothetical protein
VALNCCDATLAPTWRIDMQYSTMAFIETLKPIKRSLWRTDFVDPISRATYGWIFQFWPITILKITGWKGEQITVVKIFKREFVW